MSYRFNRVEAKPRLPRQHVTLRAVFLQETVSFINPIQSSSNHLCV